MAVPSKTRVTNPADLMKQYSDLILEERHKIQECLQLIEEYSEALRRVTADTAQRLITREE